MFLPLFFRIVFFCLLSVFFAIPAETAKKPLFTVMLNPAGDAKNAGRMLDDSFERGITLQCCQELKKDLEAIIPGIRVVLTRFPGETLEPLQNANFSNRLDANIYLSIHFYKETEAKPHLYTYCYQIELFNGKLPNGLFFCPFDKAYQVNYAQTLNHAQKLMQLLTSTEKENYILHPPLTIPFKPLVGIQAPALAIEIGIKTVNCYQPFKKACILFIHNMVNDYLATLTMHT